MSSEGRAIVVKVGYSPIRCGHGRLSRSQTWTESATDALSRSCTTRTFRSAWLTTRDATVPEDALNAVVAVTAHDDEVDVELLGDLENSAPWIAVDDNRRLEVDVGGGLRQPAQAGPGWPCRHHIGADVVGMSVAAAGGMSAGSVSTRTRETRAFRAARERDGRGEHGRRASGVVQRGENRCE